MAFNSLISRTADAAALIPEEVSAEILKNVPAASAVMSLGRKLPNMSVAQRRMPVMSALATAYFVDGDIGLIQTTEASWANKYIDAEELAVIVPIPKLVLDDVNYDIWAEVRPSIEEAIGRAIDAAVLYGTNIPATWTTNLGAAGLIAVIAAASQGISLAAYTDLYEAVLGETAAGVSGLFGLIEADGFMVSGSIASASLMRKLRNARDSDGQPIFSNDPQQKMAYMLNGTPCIFPQNGAISATYHLIAGQWNQLVWAMRQDITYEISTQGVLNDNAGKIVYNLFQQNMVALKATVRLGFALPNPINRINETAATRCAFSYLTA